MEKTGMYIDNNKALIQLIADQGDDGLFALGLIVKLLTPLSIVTSGSNRLSVDIQNIIGAIASVTTVTTVSTVSNQTNMGGLSAFDMQYNLGHMAYATSIGNFQ